MIDKPRILIVTNTYPTTEMPGDGPQVWDQVEALKAKGVIVDLLYIDRYTAKKKSYARAAWQIFLLSFRRKRYHLIHAYYGYCGLLARLQFRYPVIVTFLGSDLLERKDGRIGKVVAKLVDRIIVQSTEMKRVAKREDAYIIPFGINPEFFISYPMDVARSDLGLSPDEKLVLFPWNPTRPVKRYDLIQEAVQIVQRRIDRVRLVPVFDQPHETLAKYMNACNVMALASEHEGSPMAVREAMACGLPVVSVDVGDVKNIIGDTEGCYLCERKPSDIAEKLIMALERDSRTSGVSAVRHSDAARVSEQVLLVYDSVLKLNHRKVSESYR